MNAHESTCARCGEQTADMCPHKIVAWVVVDNCGRHVYANVDHRAAKRHADAYDNSGLEGAPHRLIRCEGVLDQPCALEIAADAQAKCDTLRERVRALRRVIGMAENDLMCAADALKKHAEGIPVVLPFSAAEYAVDAARKCRKVLSATESEASR